MIIKEEKDSMPLNKYLAHAGISSRRNAVEIIKQGEVIVNGKQITEPGFKVMPKDEVIVRGDRISNRKEAVYVLLNKPFNTITTTDDTHGRVTVMDLVKGASTEKFYPIGRLDKNTTGVLILTNDGLLTQKLSHPSYEVRKIYVATLDKPLTHNHFDRLSKGITLEDGEIKPDTLHYLVEGNLRIVRLEIHSGKNHIVRRMFEHLGYEVKKLDRIMFANIGYGNLKPGEWRYLSDREVEFLSSTGAGKRS